MSNRESPRLKRRAHQVELNSIQKDNEEYKILTKKYQKRRQIYKNDHRKQWAECQEKCTPQQRESEKQIQKEKKKAQEYRTKISKLHEQARRKQEEKEGSIKQWRRCGVCEKEYSKRLKHSPRVLACGHTICYACCFQLATSIEIYCPFDRIGTGIPKTMLNKLPVNLALLHM